MPTPSGTKLAVTIGACSETGPKPDNQDFYGALIPEGADLSLKGIAVAVADGLSSSTVSRIAAEIAVKSVLTDYYCTSDTWSAKTAGERVIRAANSWLHGESRRKGLHGNRGYVTTLSAVIFKGRSAHIFHVGDSRVYSLAGDNLEQLTRDHYLALSQTERYLNRAMGVEPDVEIDYQAADLNSGDVFVLTTDGVHEFVDPREMAALIINAASLDEAARAIVDRALALGSNDNLTVQIIRIDAVAEKTAQDTAFDAEQSVAAVVPRIPFDIDGFRIVREIHATDRSQVYVAIDSEAGRQVALKVLAPAVRDSQHARRRLAMEEWVARRLDSPHVVAAVKTERPRNSLYTVTEQISKGLRAFHRKEMLHQDIRPENIMIDTNGTVKIIDLGSVRVSGVSEALPAIETGDVLGTYQYSAPEYFLGRPGTERSDFYSLGVIAFEMLTGLRPYSDPVWEATTPKAQAALFYVPAPQLSPRVPEWMDYALRKAVSIDPDARYEDMSEFVADLDRPSDAFAPRAFMPLTERNPLLFWKILSLVLFLIIVWLLAKR
jgi:serine/threonine protein phosphatase PrpC